MAPRLRITAGIDLSASPRTTAICRIKWDGAVARAEFASAHGTDERIAETIRSAERTGIDAPFGWPQPFVAAVTAHAVSTEKLGVTAMRCALALDAAQQVGALIDRSGVTGAVCEAYPAGALHAWGIDRTGYKQADNPDARRRILRALRTRFPALDVDGRLVVATDHALDALLCALVARAVLDKGTNRPESPEDLESARIEGWIHLPRRDWPAKVR
ncbi:MAG: hypothetical protein QOF76_4415 [Solirubrobacteraceae bacterium]|nr:hypothetical protein [Solirubrobacteraceae bacterium]